MSERKIQVIIGLMCLALIGLVGFQWYWIREAVALRTDEFNQKVAESVQRVTYKIEKLEMHYVLKQKLEAEQQREKLNRISQLNEKQKRTSFPQKAPTLSTNATALSAREPEIFPGANFHPRLQIEPRMDALSPSFRIVLERQEKLIDEFFQAQRLGTAGLDEFMRRRLMEEASIVEFFKDDDWRAASPEHRRGGSTGDSARLFRLPNGKAGTVQRKRNIEPERDASITNFVYPNSKPSERSAMLREVMQDILFTSRPINERVNRFLLDTLLKKELEQNGISLPFEFSVRSQNSKEPLFASTTMTAGEWDKRAYKAVLFPDEIQNSNHALYIYFPDQGSFIMGKLSAMFAGSGILIATVMACFFLAVTTILRQKKLSDIKNDFLNNMTHEFKTPISTIALASEMAQESSMQTLSPESPSRISRYLDIIQEENKRLGTHVEKVLQMALLDKGEIKMKTAVVNVHQLIEKAFKGLSMQVEKRQGILELQFDASEEEVTGDEVHLTNVLYNLLDNAIKYSPAELKIGIRTSNVEQGIRIEISDKGIGIMKDQTAKIFDKFYRVPTGNLHDIKGFGLGLSYVKKIVEAHGGHVLVKSTPEKGSTFTVWLPTTPNGAAIS